jgi:hypothetical protein
MFKIKISVIAGVCGFALSLLIALIAGVGFPALVIRPIIFCALFFGGATLVQFLVNTKLGELVEGGVDLTLDDDGDDRILREDLQAGNEALKNIDFAPFSNDGASFTKHRVEASRTGGVDAGAEKPESFVDMGSSFTPDSRSVLAQNESSGYNTAGKGGGDGSVGPSFEPLTYGARDTSFKMPDEPEKIDRNRRVLKTGAASFAESADPKGLARAIQTLLTKED